MHCTDEKGTNVNQVERNTKIPSLLSCIVGTDRAYLRIAARCASSMIVLLGAVIIAGALALGMFAPGLASAHYVRPFVRQVTGSTGGSFIGPGGIAIDGEDNLWVGEETYKKANEQQPFQLDKFASSALGNVFLEALEVEALELPKPDPPVLVPSPPSNLAIDRSSGIFYMSGESGSDGSPSSYVEVFNRAGSYAGRFGPFEGAKIAVDNSTDASAGSVYVASGGGSEMPLTVSKFNASGEPVNFSDSGKESYVSSNEITGYEAHSFPEDEVGRLAAVSAGVGGDIYVTVVNYFQKGKNLGPALLEYAPSGEFLRAIVGTGVPSLSGGVGSFGGGLEGLATDPNGDVLVSLDDETNAAVDEFDSEGHFLGQITETSPGHRISGTNDSDLDYTDAIAVDSEGDLYVVEAGTGGHAVDVYGKGDFVPAPVLGEASGRTMSSVVLNGSVNPEALLDPEAQKGIASCRFEYVTEAAYGEEGFAKPALAPCEDPSAAEIPADEQSHPVHADIGGLESGVTYRYRLAASTAGAKGGTAETTTLAFTVPHKPEILSTSVNGLSSKFADLEAQINPLGSSTTYRFEYLTVAELAVNGGSWTGPDTATSVPVPDGSIGAGGANGDALEGVLAPVGGLQPGTAYAFRVVATNAIGATYGEADTFATLPAPVLGLPDDRAYELLTPPNKGSAEDLFGEPMANGEFYNQHDYGVASESGDQFLFESKAAFGSFPASGFGANVFSRTPTGWKLTTLASSSLGVQSMPSGILFDPFDFSRVAINDVVGSEVSTTGRRMVNLVGVPGGPYATLHESPLFHNVAEANADEVAVVGASHDMSYLVLSSEDHALCPGAEALDESSHLLCEYAGGELKLVNVNSKGHLLSECGAGLGRGSTGAGATHNAVSDDGSRVFFTVPDPEEENKGEGCWNGKTTDAPQLYVRSSGSSTVEASEPEEGAPEASGHHRAEYVGASEDGSRVFFMSEGQLTKDDAGINDRELYEYDVENGKLTRISHGNSGTVAGNVQRVVAVSSEGSAVYFMANGVLASNEGTDGTQASLGDCAGSVNGEDTCNLYRYDTATGTTTYVATVGDSDMTSSGATGERSPSPWADAYTTPDGDYFLFASSRDLTGYSTVKAHSGDCNTLPVNQGIGDGHCTEVYRYHYEPQSASGGSLVCVSCNPTGAAPVSNARFARSADTNTSSGPVRAMSDDGAYAFFDTADPLVSNDSNGTLDVYEWHEGSIALISSGKDPAPSYFLGASPDGSDVFIGTHARLVPQDTDDQGDVYDARICTESEPCIKQPVGETAQCEGSSCESQPAEPLDATPTSLTFVGAGDLVSKMTSVSTVKAKSKSATQIRSEELVKALKTCRKQVKAKRKGCEAKARKRYGSKAKTKAKKSNDERRTK
jgi:hypothetical protein